VFALYANPNRFAEIVSEAPSLSICFCVVNGLLVGCEIFCLPALSAHYSQVVSTPTAVCHTHLIKVLFVDVEPEVMSELAWHGGSLY